MTTTNPVADQAARKSLVSTVWQVIVHWSLPVGVLIVAAGVILIHVAPHLFPKLLPYLETAPQDLLLIVSVLIWFLAHQVHESNEEANKEIRSLKSAIDHESQAIKGVIENTSLRLYTLQDCVTDFDATLRSIPHDQKVVIEHLGLDMTHAWRAFEKMLQQNWNLTDVDYRLLVLTDDTTQNSGCPRRGEAMVGGRTSKYRKN